MTSKKKLTFPRPPSAKWVGFCVFMGGVGVLRVSVIVSVIARITDSLPRVPLVVRVQGVGNVPDTAIQTPSETGAGRVKLPRPGGCL